MVAAVAPSPPPSTPVQETQKKEAGNVQNYGGLPPAEKLKVVRKMRTMEITSRYKTATTTTASSPLVAGRTSPSPHSRNPSPHSRNPSPHSRNPSPLRQPSPSRQPSPVRNRTTSSTSTESHVRHPSPNLGRSSSSSSNAADVTKRAFSVERRRPWPAATPSDTKSRQTTTSSTTDGIPSTTKPRPQSRTSELWPSMSAAKQSADSNGDNASDSHSEEAKETTSPQTLIPTGNGIRQRAAGENASPSPLRKGSPLRRQSIDQAENARPQENSHSKPEQQRWPGMSTGKVFSGPMSRSVDLTVDNKERPLARSSTMQARPGTPSSRMKATVSRSLSRAGSNDAPAAPARRNPTPTRGRPEPGVTNSGVTNPRVTNSGVTNPRVTNSGVTNPRVTNSGVTNSGVTNSRVTNSGVTNSVNGNGNGNGNGPHHVRRLSQDSVASLATPFENMSDTESVSSGGSARRGTTVPARVWQDMNNRLRRFSEGSDLPVIAPVKTVRRNPVKVLPQSAASSMLMNQSMNQSMNGSTTTSAWALSPGRVSGSSTPSSPSHSKGSSPLRGLPSPQRSRPVAGALAGTARSVGSATLSFGIGRGRKTLTQQEEAQLLRILHNRWLQWRFVNARAEAVTSAQKAAAEMQLYNVWIKTSELRTSVAMQRIKLQRARQAHKLRSILSTHATHLEDWETLEEEHSNALTGCMEALESAILRVPVTGGARADVQAVKEALNSAVDVLNAVEGSVHFLLPKTESMEALLSQLAETAAQERALLEECGDLLSVAASLEVEERSLRTHLIQLENERVRLFKAEPVNGTLNTSTSSYLSTP